jgi:hypothetical protein
MIKFEVCFDFLLSVVLAKRRVWRVSVRDYLRVPYPGDAKTKKNR